MAKKKKVKAKKSSGLMSKLKNLQSTWKKGKPRKAGFPVPDDDYGMEITSAVIEEARSTGRLQINYALTVLDGDYEGKICHKYAGLETEDNIDYAQGDLETLELEIPDNMDDLGPVLEGAVGLQVDCTVRTSDSFTNVDFNELLGESDTDEDAGEEDAEEDTDEEEDADLEDNPDEDADEGEGEGEEELEWPSEKEINAMDIEELRTLGKELKIKTKGKKPKALAKLCVDEIYEEE